MTQRIFPTKKKHQAQWWIILLEKTNETETREDFWQRLIEIEKECAFEGKTADT